MTDALDSAVISDPLKVPITATRKTDRGVVLRRPGACIALSGTEFDRVIAFVRNEARLMAYRVGG